VGMTTVWLVRPWRRAFREDRFLPSGVLGPVEYSALARLISVRSMPSSIIAGIRELAGENGRLLKRLAQKARLRFARKEADPGIGRGPGGPPYPGARYNPKRSCLAMHLINNE
jgi:hypothetical protein